VIGVDALEPVMPLLKPVEVWDDEEVKKVLFNFIPVAPKLKKVDLMFEENKKTPPAPRQKNQPYVPPPKFVPNLPPVMSFTDAIETIGLS